MVRDEDALPDRCWCACGIAKMFWPSSMMILIVLCACAEPANSVSDAPKAYSTEKNEQPPKSGDDGFAYETSISTNLHALIVGRASNYKTRYRALAACFSWPRSPEDQIHVAAYATTIVHGTLLGAGDVQYSVDREAVSKCKQGKREANLNCECELVDSGGMKKLVVPTDVTSRVHSIVWEDRPS
ncbi:MAG: hypothetical protein AAF666_18355 [Pseudomonadota bacterium]